MSPTDAANHDGKDDEFPITLSLGQGIGDFLYSQLFITPKTPDCSFKGQTVVVTGANSGLGLEAARYFYRLDVSKLVLATRSLSKGQAAKEYIVQSVTSRSDGASAIDVLTVDISTTASTLAFAECVKSTIPRVDVLLCNAGVRDTQYELIEGFESNMQTNVLNTFLLALSLLPKLRKTRSDFPESSPHLVIVTSDAHRLTKFREINEPDIYTAFNKKETFDGQARYQDSKLLQVLILRELVSRLQGEESGAPSVTINAVNPGLCTTNLQRGDTSFATRLLQKVLYRTAEVGARTLVHAACTGSEAHGKYLTDQKTVSVEPWIYTDIGARVQLKAYNQTMKILAERGLPDMEWLR
ncbi:NAD(P)-binding protein [Nemania abortiva]|nr:NAD(P)-binding protein [Nemania abortiva]